MKNIKRIFSLALALMLIAALFTFTVSAAAPKHEEHVDVNGDLICDIDGCQAALPHTHVDVDGDNKCDITDCDVEIAPTVEEPENTIGTEKYVPNLFESLKMMGLGMLGIFIVTGIIILVIYALSHFTNKESKENTEEN